MAEKVEDECDSTTIRCRLFGHIRRTHEIDPHKFGNQGYVHTCRRDGCELWQKFKPE